MLSLVQWLRDNRATSVMVMLFLILSATVTGNLFRPRADARLDAMRRQGYPVTLSELDKWYPAVPDSQNNARIYERAFAMLDFGRDGDINWPDPGPALSAQDKKELMELVMVNQGALALLHSAQASNRSHYSFDLTKVFSVSTGHHINVLNGVLLLGAEALVHADNGDSQQAVGSFMAAGMLADSLAEEPFLLAQIVRDAGWNIIARRLEHALALTQLTEEQLALLQAMVERAEQPRALLRGLAGERATGIAAFADPIMILQDRPPYNTTECLKNDMIIGSSKSTGVFETDRTFYLDALAMSVAASSLPFPGRVNLGQQTPGVAPRFCILSRRILPRISATFTSEANTTARLRAAQVALAVERFRCRYAGKLPATLEELVPDYCKALPADPFTGGPLRFQALDSGFAIYSSRTDPRNGGPLGFRIFQ